MAFDGHDARYLDVRWLEQGLPKPALLKAWVYRYTDGQRLVYLELRRLLVCCGKLAKTHSVHDVVNRSCKDEGDWVVSWAPMGLAVEDCLVRSAKANRFRNKLFNREPPAELVRSEWQITLLGALCILCQWSVAGMKRSQETSQLVLQSLLESTIGREALPELLLHFRDPGIMQSCLQRAGLQLCVHLPSLHADIGRVSVDSCLSSFWPSFLSCFLKAWIAVDNCQAARALCKVLLETLAQHIAHHTVESSHGDVMLGRDLDPAAQGRNCVDEDVVQFLRQEAAAKHLSRGVINDVHDVAYPSQGAVWQRKDACRYAANCWEEFQSNKSSNVVVAVSLDAKRLGDPGVDLLVGACSRSCTGIWLPPQATWNSWAFQSLVLIPTHVLRDLRTKSRVFLAVAATSEPNSLRAPE